MDAMKKTAKKSANKNKRLNGSRFDLKVGRSRTGLGVFAEDFSNGVANLLQVWDLLSLYVCSHEQHKEHVIAPAPTAYATGSAGVTLKLTPTAPATITVEPFPFDRAPLEAAVVYRMLPSSALHSDEMFKAAYFGARPQAAVFTFVATH